MKPICRLLPLAFLLPLGGCVFAVGGDGENESLRDKVRGLEKRVDRLEHRGGQGIITINGKAMEMRGGVMIREEKEEEEEGEEGKEMEEKEKWK